MKKKGSPLEGHNVEEEEKEKKFIVLKWRACSEYLKNDRDTKKERIKLNKEKTEERKIKLSSCTAKRRQNTTQEERISIAIALLSGKPRTKRLISFH